MKAEYVNHWLAIAIIASLLLLPACIFDDDDYTDPLDANGIEGAKESNLDRESLPVKYEPSTVSELIAEGKAALEIRDSLTAHEKFERALYLDPQNSDAACGLVLAGGIRTVDTIGDLIGQLEDPHMPFGKEGGMGDCVQELIRNSLLPILNEMAQAIEIALADPNFSFWLEHYPLFVDGDHALLDMGNEWDAADMIGARGFVLLLMGFSHTILSLEADFNWDTVFHWDFGGKDITDQIIAICDLLITLLSDEDYPDFLKLNEDGYLLLPKAGLEYGHGLRDLGSFYDYVRMETDPQDDDVAGYVAVSYTHLRAHET